MAKPRTLSFANFKVLLGDGSSPEMFAAPCGFTQKALTLTAANSGTVVPDCDDPEAPAWEEKGVTSLSAQITGQGVLSMASLSVWREWWSSGLAQNVRLLYDDTGANGGGYWEGPALLTSIGDSVQLSSNGNKVQTSITIDSAGAWTWTDAA